jgi:glyoxylase-like metal-dependent hydrolase (beta-lactamase superfamily II)
MLRFDPLKPASGPVLDRRRFIIGAAGLAASAAWPVRLWAAEAPFTFKQGDFEVSVVSDGHLTLPSNIFAGDAPPEERKALLDAAGLGGENIMPAANPVVIRTGSDLILFDTGSGTSFQPTAGKLIENLTAAGIDPGSITKVVFTHGHPDHMWGTVAEAGLKFPNATYYSGAAEWDFWNNPDIFNQMPPEMHDFVKGAQRNYVAVKDRVTMLKPGDEIVTGISALDTAGHTPGHMSFEVAGGEGLIIVADVLPLPAVYFPHPEWKFGFDASHDMAIAARQKLLDRAATDKMKMIGFHWPYPGVGFAERKDTAYQYVPVS